VLAAAGFAGLQAPQYQRVVWRGWVLGRPNIKVTYAMDPSPPTIQGAWWYLDAQQLAGLSNDMRSRWAHVVRIMETDCGVQRVGNPCTFCATHNYECWVYTDLAQGKISNARLLVLAAESIVMLAVVLSLRQESGSQKPLVLHQIGDHRFSQSLRVAVGLVLLLGMHS